MSTQHRTFCRICSAACALIVTTRVAPTWCRRGAMPTTPVSNGYACPKGRSVGALHHHCNRIDGAPHARLGRGAVASRLGHSPRRPGGAAATRAGRSRQRTPWPSTWPLRPRSTRSVPGTGPASARAWRPGTRYSAVTLDSPSKPLVAELMAGRSDLLPAVDRQRATLSIFIGVNPVVSHGHFNAFPDPVDAPARAVGRGPRGVGDRPPATTETARLATQLPATPPRNRLGAAGPPWRVSCSSMEPTLRTSTSGRRASTVCATRWRRSIEPWRSRRTGLTGKEIDGLPRRLARPRARRRPDRDRHLHGSCGQRDGMAHVGPPTSSRAPTTGPAGCGSTPVFIGCHDRRTVSPAAEVIADAEPPPSRPDLPSRMGEYPSAALVDQIEKGEVRALIVFGRQPPQLVPPIPSAWPPRSTPSTWWPCSTSSTPRRSITATHALGCTDPLERADVPYFLDQFLAEVGSRYNAGRGRSPPPSTATPGRSSTPLGERLGIDVLPADVDPGTRDRGRAARSHRRTRSGPVRGAPGATAGRGRDLDLWVGRSLSARRSLAGGPAGPRRSTRRAARHRPRTGSAAHPPAAHSPAT